MRWTLLLLIASIFCYSGIVTPPDPIVIQKPVYVEKPIYIPVFSLQPSNRYIVRDQQILYSLAEVGNNIFLPIQHYANQKRGKPTYIKIESLYRNWPACSQHFKGEAIDLNVRALYADFSNHDIYLFVRNYLQFDQLIIYNNPSNPTHVHISYINEDDSGRCNRGQVLFAYWTRKGWKYKNIS